MEAIAKRYAESLFDLAIDENAVESYAKSVDVITTVFYDNPSFISFFSHILIEDNDKYQLLDKSFGDSIEKYVLNFLKLLIKKRRIQYIVEICEHFKQLHNEYLGIVEGIVYSPYELSSDEIKEIEKTVSKKENKKVTLVGRVDKALIGGVKVQIENRIIDASIQNQLEILKKELLRK